MWQLKPVQVWRSCREELREARRQGGEYLLFAWKYSPRNAVSSPSSLSLSPPPLSLSLSLPFISLEISVYTVGEIKLVPDLQTQPECKEEGGRGEGHHKSRFVAPPSVSWLVGLVPTPESLLTGRHHAIWPFSTLGLSGKKGTFLDLKKKEKFYFKNFQIRFSRKTPITFIFFSLSPLLEEVKMHKSWGGWLGGKDSVRS